MATVCSKCKCEVPASDAKLELAHWRYKADDIEGESDKRGKLVCKKCQAAKLREVEEIMTADAIHPSFRCATCKVTMSFEDYTGQVAVVASFLSRTPGPAMEVVHAVQTIECQSCCLKNNSDCTIH